MTRYRASSYLGNAVHHVHREYRCQASHLGRVPRATLSFIYQHHMCRDINLWSSRQANSRNNKSNQPERLQVSKRTSVSKKSYHSKWYESAVTFQGRTVVSAKRQFAADEEWLSKYKIISRKEFSNSTTL